MHSLTKTNHTKFPLTTDILGHALIKGKKMLNVTNLYNEVHYTFSLVNAFI